MWSCLTLAPQDCFGLVTFDSQAELVIPPMLMADHNMEALQRAVANIHTGGSTDLSAGYLLALRETKRSLTDTHHAAGRKSRTRSMDLLIAVTAHAHGARLITSNVSDCSHLSEVLDIVEF